MSKRSPYDDFDPDAKLDPLTAPEPEAIELDRGETTTKAPKKKKRGMLLLVFAVIIGSIVAIVFFVMFMLRATSGPEVDTTNLSPDQAITRTSSGPNLGAFQERLEKQLADQRAREAEQRAREQEQQRLARLANETDTAPPSTTASQAPSLGNYQGREQRGTSRGNKDELTPEELAEIRRFESGVLWGDTQSTGAAPDDKAESTRTSSNGRNSKSILQGVGGAEVARSGESIGAMLRTEVMADGYAYVRPDLKFLLINGTTIPCTLIPRIVTNYPGHTSCLINRDVYSADGSVVLIERGSVANGERRISIQPGDAKVFVSWGSIETPNGVKVGIDSGGADQLGAAGLDAWINNHYAKRFGGAILLSFLDDAFQYIADEARSGRRDQVRFDSSSDNAQDMAAMALENTIGIPPTGYVQHATETNIIVARDIDFRHVYEVR